MKAKLTILQCDDLLLTFIPTSYSPFLSCIMIQVVPDRPGTTSRTSPVIAATCNIAGSVIPDHTTHVCASSNMREVLPSTRAPLSRVRIYQNAARHAHAGGRAGGFPR